jgi:hypothetical protein
MTKAILILSAALALIALNTTSAHAQNELDRNQKDFTNYAGDPSKQTVILKVDKATGRLSVLSPNKSIKNNEEAQQVAKDGKFLEVAKDKVRADSELDKVKGVSSWYFSYDGYYGYYPVYNWGYNWYQPFYGWYWNNSYYFYYNYWGWNSGWNGWNGWYGWRGYNPYYGRPWRR